MLWYAHGPLRETSAVPASAFSRGDVLMFTSASSLSRIPTSTASVNVLANNPLIIGVANSSSLESIDNKVVYTLAQLGTVFWSDATTTSQFTAGEALDLEYTGATFRVSTSAITPAVIIDPLGGSVDIIDSARSRVKVTFDPTMILWSAQS